MNDKRTNKHEIEKKDNKITETANAATPYIIVDNNDDDIHVDEWSTGNHIHDSGFNTGTIDDDYKTVDGDSESVSVNRTDQTGSARNLSSGDYYLNFENPDEDTTVTRTLTDLEPGKRSEERRVGKEYI